MLTAGLELSDLVSTNEQIWNAHFDAIAYPCLWIDGLTLTPDTLFRSTLPEGVVSFNAAIQFAAERDLGFWLSLDLDLKPVRSDLVHVRSMDGQPSSHACINTPAAAEATKRILAIAQAAIQQQPRLRLEGVSLSMQDLWPIGGGAGVVELSCFCRHCTAFIEASSPGLLSNFHSHPSPWDLVLRDDGDGVSHLNNFTIDTTVSELLSMSRSRGFLPSHANKMDELAELAADSAKMEEWASHCLEYARTRSRLTIEAMKRIAAGIRQTLGTDIKISATISDFPFDWIGGTFMSDVDTDPPVDEYWMESNDSPTQLSHAPVRWYMYDRARYYLLGFTDRLEAAVSPVQRRLSGIGDRDMRRQIQEMAATATSRLLSAPIAADLMRAQDPHARFVVPALNEASIGPLADRFSPSAPELSREDLLRQIQAVLSPEEPS